MSAPKQSTTLRCPSDLYNRAKQAVADGFAKNLNDLLVDALADKLHRIREQQIDAAFEVKHERT